MSSHGLVSSFEKLEMFVGEDSNENHGTQSDASSSTRDTLKAHNCNTGHGSNFIDDADKAYIVLLNLFRFLSTKDLLKAAQVCKVWNLVGSDKIFWTRITLNNCVVHDIDMMVQFLKQHETEILDLRGMSFFKIETEDDRFDLFYEKRLFEALSGVTTLTEVTVDVYSSQTVTLLAEGVPQLKSISAYCVNEELDEEYIMDMDMPFLENMRNLKTLKIESRCLIALYFETFDKIKLNLTTLAITKAVNLSCIEHILPSTLVSLELGDCRSLSYYFYENVLPTLVNLTRLRLDTCTHTRLIISLLVEEVSKLSNLAELELINFEIDDEFDEMIARCINLKSLIVIPWYRGIPEHSHPLMNSLILSGLLNLKNTMQEYVGVITHLMILVKIASSLRIGPNLVEVRVMGCSDSLQFLSRGSFVIKFDSSDNAQLLPNLEFKIFKYPSYSSTWKLSFHRLMKMKSPIFN